LELLKECGRNEELKTNEKWLAKASTISCGSVIILSSTSIWTIDLSSLLKQKSKSKTTNEINPFTPKL
jgi:hypothetical protein